MGSLISRFRKKPTTFEVLESLEKEIETLQKFRRDNLQKQKSFITKLMLYSILMYIVASVIFYFYFFPNNWRDRLLYSSPLLIFPVLVWLIRKFLHWFFVKRIAKNDLALQDLKEKKKKILEDVMETETYKKAKEILERFDPERFKEMQTPAPSTPKLPSPGSDMRQRVNARMATIGPTGGTHPRPATPYPRAKTPGMGQPMPKPYTTPNIPGQIRPRMLASPQQGPSSLTRPIPPRDRTKMDRVLEYLLGDGPQHKYALICQKCASHNGMALKEEFEYIAFRCAYCRFFNPARKQRPTAPKLDFESPVKSLTKSGIEEEEDEETEESDTESIEEEGEDKTANSTSSTKESTQEMKVTSTSILREEQAEENPDESMETDQTEPVQTQLSDHSEPDDFQHIDPVEDFQEKT
ncbi:endoplasmic reticulum junction formation protein lunapark-B-like isoform X2 [Saccostrea echinata]|uniref:endoplasmic reticulum junction formation protein lunapark-B-like isoform X2 n=1 Tax=Saccostrea echinata TaxID=191078 RepID=UPI002A7FCC3F|nr:endoplasmic reticulum junction formation protein lunapark-B-like isoform X2 [Saccostrea echinata]